MFIPVESDSFSKMIILRFLERGTGVRFSVFIIWIRELISSKDLHRFFRPFEDEILTMLMTKATRQPAAVQTYCEKVNSTLHQIDLY